MNNFIICESCNSKIDSDYEFCPECGETIIYDDKDALPGWVEMVLDNGEPIERVRQELEYAQNMHKTSKRRALYE